MLTFNQYFGYRGDLSQKLKRNLKRTEVSNEKLGGSIERKNSQRKIMNSSYFMSSRNNTSSSNPKHNRKTLKSSPFKSLSRKYFLAERISIQPPKQSITEQNKHIYERFNKQSHKSKKDKVENKKDSFILRFIKRKEDQEEARFAHKLSSSFQNKIKNQAERKKTPYSQPDKKLPDAVEKLKVSNQGWRGANQYGSEDHYHTKFYSESRVESEGQNEVFMDSMFESEAQKDCVLNPQDEEDDDQYQIKGSQNVYSKGRDAWKNSEKSSSRMSQSLECERGLLEPVDIRIKKHYSKLQRLLNYVSQIKKMDWSKIEPFQRQIYLCRRMYFAQITKMRDCLTKNAKSCFVLAACQISESQLQEYISFSTSSLALRVRQLDSQIDAMRESLTEESAELMIKKVHDPYIHFSSNHFEPELISELYEEMIELSDKIAGKWKGDKETLIRRRSEATQVILLIAELCGFKKEIHRFVKVGTQQQIFNRNQSVIEEIVYKFQQMPL